MEVEKKTLSSKFRSLIWPIENFELKKFLPMAFMLFFILFNYTILRSLKDSLVIPLIGAESTTFLKLWGVLPSALLFMVMYMKLVNVMEQENVFYCITGFFIAFFIAFLLFLYPNADSIHPDPAKIAQYVAEYPRMKWFILLYSKWIYAVFFILAEIWGSMMVSLLFWQFANKITSTNEAKRFYATFGIIANISGIAAGHMISSSTKVGSQNGIDPHHYFANTTVPMTMILVTISAIIIIGLFKWMHKYVLTNPIFYTPKESKKKTKLSLIDSFKLIFSSKYLGLIALLILCYGISMNIVEGPWKDKIKQLHPSQLDYLNFMGRLNFWTGVGSLVVFIIGNNVLRRFSWFTAAIMTPIMMFATGALFYIFYIYSDDLGEYTLMLFGATPLMITVTLGMMQNILSKCTKYSLFDPTKEMAYIPIDDELKTKGKAAVDVVGGRIGKAGGAFILSNLLTIFPNGGFSGIINYVFVIFIVTIILWVYAVSGLSKEYNKYLEANK